MTIQAQNGFPRESAEISSRRDVVRSNIPPARGRFPACLRAILSVSFFFASGACLLRGESYVERDSIPLYTEFLDPDFPFIETTVDFRGITPSGNGDNAAPRAVVIPLDADTFVCFDTELLRVAAVWKGGFLTPESMAMISYLKPMQKIPPGQGSLPHPIGEIHASTGLYPGWHHADHVSFEDPRSRWVEPAELGRGPLPESWGLWQGVEDAGNSALLRYSLFGGTVTESFETRTIDGTPALLRFITLKEVETPLTLVLNDLGDSSDRRSLPVAASRGEIELRRGRYQTLAIPAEKGERTIVVAYPLSDGEIRRGSFANIQTPRPIKSRARWSETVSTGIEIGEEQGDYAVDEIAIPYPNPWKRRIRPIEIKFLESGDAIVATYDGDIYRVSGMGGGDEVIWQRIAAGFHEPQGLAIRDGDVFVFSRLGVTRLVDRDRDGETDFYSMFCNRFTQSPGTRDFPLGLESCDDGSFVISKGGQQVETRTPHSGRVLSISADGAEISVIASGLRNGYISRNPHTDLITASDQQGQWIPSTPFHVIKENAFYGHGRSKPSEPTPVEEPVLWLPHRIAQSGADQVWCLDPRQGPLQGSLLYVDYYKPRLIGILTSGTEPVTDAVGFPLPIEFKSPLLKGDVNPADGLPYFAGFQIFGSVAERLEGICRVRPLSDSHSLPVGAKTFAQGVLLEFSSPIDLDSASNPLNYQVSSWDYVRSSAYGSPQYKANGSPGVDGHFVHSALARDDGRAVFLAIRDVHPAMQLEAQYNLFGSWQPVYFTPRKLSSFHPEEHGFGSTDIDEVLASEPMPRDTSIAQAIVSVARGQELYLQFGCVGCHSVDGTTDGKVGPSWLDVYNRTRPLADGSRVKGDEAYLRRAMLDPAGQVLEGYGGPDAAMPSYAGILLEADLDSLILYIRSLR